MTGLRRHPLVLVLLLAAAWLLILPACGRQPDPGDDEEEQEETVADDPQESSDDEEEEAEEEDEREDPSLELGNWVNPQGVHDLSQQFSRIVYSFAKLDGGEETEKVTVDYRLEGQESVSGVQADKVILSVTGDHVDDEMVVWVADDGELLQMEVNGQPMEVFMSEIMLDYLFWPFMLAGSYQVDQVFEGRAPGVTWETIDSGSQRFGEYTAQVTTFKVSMGMEGQKAAFVWSVGDFGQFQMLTSWDVDSESETDQDYAVRFRLEEVATR